MLGTKFRNLFKLIFNIHGKTGLYEYKNYDEYKQTQIEGNRQKLGQVWAAEENIKFLSEYLKSKIPEITFGICHGTRRGKEQEWFSKYLGVDNIIGTEISPTALEFPKTIQWDFHEVKNEWLDNVDFIYSNSFDHSYKPKECLDAWMSCVKKSSGLCIIEWTNGHIEHNKLDPFGGTMEDYKKLAGERYRIEAILPAPTNSLLKPRKTYFFVIAHRKDL